MALWGRGCHGKQTTVLFARMYIRKACCSLAKKENIMICEYGSVEWHSDSNLAASSLAHGRLSLGNIRDEQVCIATGPYILMQRNGE